MKRCPQCGRDYTDDTLSFCLDDGAGLLDGPASIEEPLTALLPEGLSTTESPTRTLDPAEAEATKRYGEENGKATQGKGKLIAVIAGVVAVAALAIGGYWFFGRGASEQIESIAVMPFENESGDANLEYLSDGMTETLINSLSQIPDLNVKARTLVFRFKGKEIEPKEVASKLGVQALLTGRVIKQGDQLTLSVELIDGETENTIWGHKYDRKGSDLVSLQSEVARDVSKKLISRISGEDAAKVEKRSTTDPEAYQLYLKGRFLWNKRTIASLKQAAEYYQQAIDKDPNYALAYAGLAETYAVYMAWSIESPMESLPKAKTAASRALELDDSLAAPHAAIGLCYVYYDSDRDAAEKEIRRAIELDPNYATAHQWLGSEVLPPVRRFDEAISELKRAEELDPLSPIIGTRLADVMFYAGRREEAIEKYKRTLELNPNFGYAHQQLGVAYGIAGKYPQAISEARHSLELNPDPTGKGFLALWLAKSGSRDEALKLLDELKQEASERYVQSYAFALVYLGLGEKDKALEWLEKELSEHGLNAQFFGVYGELEELHSEPRFKAMLKQQNLPE